MKVGVNPEDDARRAGIIREEVGLERKLMMDANQVWDVEEAIERMEPLKEFDPWWIEETTSLDDAWDTPGSRKPYPPSASSPASTARTASSSNSSYGCFCQVGACRLGGVNEVLSVPS